MRIRRRLIPNSMEGQMIGVVALSLLGLLLVLAFLEIRQHKTAIEWAERPSTMMRVRDMRPIVENMPPAQLDHLLGVASLCHSGFTVTKTPFRADGQSLRTEQLRRRLATDLSVDLDALRVVLVGLTREDFAYRKCRHSEIDLPFDGIVISLRLASGRWLNTEVHPHEWHVQDKIDWIVRSGAAFLVVGGIAIFFMRRIGQPLRHLTAAAARFGSGLHIVPVEARGPPDLRRAIGEFNAMQRRVVDEVERRTQALAAISHDVRTPLTALRIKAELLTDEATQRDLIFSIERMETITASALAYLRGESRAEAMREIDLSALIESECDDFERIGQHVHFDGPSAFRHLCRSDALARAVRNLIDNAVKYAGHANVTLQTNADSVSIVVADRGPGIPPTDRARAVEPFERFSARTTPDRAGFGLGLAVVKAIAEGHEGRLVLETNKPRGLRATIRLPRTSRPTEV